MKFIGIWILNPLKTSGGQPVALGGFGVWLGGYFFAWVLIDTIIHPCFKHAVSHVARVCAFGHWNPSSRTPLIMCVLLVNLTTLFVDGFGFEHDLDALWILLGSGFWTLWNQWRAASGIGGFGVWPPFLGFDWSFLFLVTSAFARRYFVEMLVIPWWHLYPWWPFVAFCGLLWPLGVFGWWFVVQSATSMDTAVFCGICDNYGIYGDTVGLQCISNLFLVIFTPFRGFSAKFGCFGWNMIFWDAFLIQNFSPAVSGWWRLLNSRCFTWAQACPWCVLGVCVSWMQQAMRFLRNSFKLCTSFTIHRLGADLDYNVIVEHVFVMTSWFSHTPSRLVITL